MKALALLCLAATVAIAEPKVEIVELPAQPIVYRTVKAPPPKLEAELQRAFLAILALTTKHGIDPAGPPLARYTSRGEVYVVEAALPVRKAPDRIKGLSTGTLPAGPAATLEHRGPLVELPRSHAALDAWLAANKRHAAGPRWELFLDPAAPIVKIVVPLEH
jgi:effector-binding domain-containing protein